MGIATTHEPPPDGGDAPVWPVVIHDAQLRGIDERVVADMQERDRVKTAEYGTPLRAHNGRRMLVDAYQEGLDMAAYMRGHLIENWDDVAVWLAYWATLGLLEVLRRGIGDAR